MVFFRSGSIFTSIYQTLVNPIDLSGAMGAGLALDFANRFPNLQKGYKAVSSHMSPGMLWIYKHSADLWALCFPTKFHWNEAADINLIEMGLKKFVATYEQRGITSIAFPKLGCGLGGLEWSDVKPLMVSYLDQVEIPVTIYV